MPVIALWSPPRARSTAFFRAMLERGDLVALHEPFCNVMDHGDTDLPGVAGGRVESAEALLDWLHAHLDTIGVDGSTVVFLKDTTDRRHAAVLADERFLAGARHAFLIRHPAEIAASHYAIRPEMGREEIGLEHLHEMFEAVERAGGHPVVVDSDDLVARPDATMAAFAAAVGLPHRPDALTWDAGERPEWRRTSEWHADVAASTRIERREQSYADTVDTSELLAGLAAHHRPYYERLRGRRLVVPE